MKLAYTYGRVSTSDQMEHGYSPENQKQVCRSFAEANGYQIIAEFFDEGKTGRNIHRDEFQAMMKAINERPVQAIVIYKLDRLFRSLKDFSQFVEMLKKKSIKLLSVSEGGDVSEGILGKILAALAEHESEIIGMRTKDGMHQKFSQGFYPGQAPLGYRNVTRNERKVVEPDPSTAPLVVEMFKMYATGQYSQLELCEILYKRGLRGRRSGSTLSPQTATGILNNSFYYGWMKWGKKEGLGKHKSLVSKTLFDQVQFILSCNNTFLTRKRKRFFLLRGFVYCPTHNRRLTAEHNDLKSGKEICYYHCSNRGGCKPSYCETQKLEKKVANLFKDYEFSDDFIELVRKGAKKHVEHSRKEKAKFKTALNNKKQGLLRKRNHLEDLLIDEDLDRNIFNRRHKKIEQDLNNINKQIHELDSQENIDFSVVEEILALTRNISQTYKDAPDYLKRRYLRLFFQKVFIQDKKIVKVIDTPIFQALKREKKILLRGSRGP